jgi:glycosyltransferase involved in cell wall biosynthesis
MEPLRLLFVIDFLGTGGAQRQMVTLALAMRRRGHSVDFFCYHESKFYLEALRDADINLYCHPKSWRFSPRPLWDLRQRMKQGDYDLVLSFLPVPNLYSTLARLGMRKQPKLVISERSGEKGRSKFTPLYRYSDHTTVNSYHMREFYCRIIPWIEGRIDTIWNGVDLDAFQATPLPVRNGELRLLGIGNVAKYKNWRCIIEALAILRDQYGLRPKFDHVGQITNLSPKNHVCLSEMNHAIERLDLGDQWHTMGQRSDMPEVISCHHALIHPSYLEGLPNAICESLACGRPVIAGDTLDHPRLVQDGQTGFLFDWTSPEDLAKAIHRLSECGDSEWVEMSTAARRFAEAELSVEIFADRYEALFRRLTSIGKHESSPT